MINRKGPILLQDNARPHVATVTLQRLNKLGYEILLHLPYSPDLSPTDYHVFKHINYLLNQKYFTLKDAAKKPSRISEFYEIGIEKFVSRWESVLMLMGVILININVSQWSYLILK